MTPTFNGATTIKTDLLTDIRCASQAGFKALEIWKTKLLTELKERDIEFIAKQFKDYSILPSTINSVEQFTFCEDFEQKKKEFELLSKIASKIGVETIIVVPGFVKAMPSAEEIKEKTKKALREFSDLAKLYNVKIGFEFLGFENCSVNNLKMALEIVESLDRENVGLVIDTFHFFTGGSSFEDLKRTPSERIFVVHANDLPRLNHKPKDSDRIMPGDGILPLKEFLTVVKQIGYKGIVSVELFNEKYWQLDPCLVAKEAYQKLTRLL
ncbi:sugar phosphate isomerase/epimerase family protein [Pseudothermotoga thermarum]|uniref:Xylose isomerase domain-containing protein TIM barrel n=1 Tax=Pseudothermotoga thermarum DSM 5069 TaxID=688269 RepID=F7YTH0_9THEM|nr:sugar phosphate isomerase/epimerase [Pseudothermotoga thermarum]AEH51184.1 Xylose isomerase domain-containing protein TIM barrel [Pseudothermotoga thermarum DSM 5069]